MGFRVQLIAVSGMEPAVIHREYGVVPTGRHEEIPESPVVGALRPGGAYLLYVNDEIVPDDRVFARLSRDASLAACYANETVMNSFACAWAHGVQRWSLFHDCQQGIEHLEAAGTLPDEFPAIRDRLVAQQKGWDDTDYLFDVPVQPFMACGGIRYDSDLPNGTWEILERRA